MIVLSALSRLSRCFLEASQPAPNYLACFHSSSHLGSSWRDKFKGGNPEKYSRGRTRPTSRIRLAKDVRPRDGRGLVNKRSIGRTEVAPVQRKFSEGRDCRHKKFGKKSPIEDLLDAEFDRAFPAKGVPHLPTEFSSPPLSAELLHSIHDVLGSDAHPTPVQALSLKHLFPVSSKWRQSLLAAETGSGKTFAYLLPLLQYLKSTEAVTKSTVPNPLYKELPLKPRAIILAPTHELARQLSSSAKSLIHRAKLRVLCASRANLKNVLNSKSRLGDSEIGGNSLQENREASSISRDENVRPRGGIDHSVDVLVATPVKALEMARGWGWDKVNEPDGRRYTPAKPEMGLERIEYVVIDEADILYDQDFKDTTLTLLSDISTAKGFNISSEDQINREDSPYEKTVSPIALDYPFHLTLTSATIPASLAAHLDDHHPRILRLASPRLHKLPDKLRTEHAASLPSQRFADVATRIRQVWSEDALRGVEPRMGRTGSSNRRTRILIFVNRGTRAEQLSEYLDEHGIPSMALSGSSEKRGRGSNRHLAGFLQKTSSLNRKSSARHGFEDSGPRVLVTTSLLSRGLDFTPDVRHVFVVDPPRNMVDFLHRAGRAARAGRSGTVVIFGRMKGRGSEANRQMRRKVSALAR